MRFEKTIVPALLLFSPFVLAEEPAVDFTGGLARLAELGLPEMKGALWVEQPGDSERTFTASYEFQEIGIKMSGNAWELATQEPSYVEFGSATTIETPAEEKGDADPEDAGGEPGLLEKMLSNYQKKNPEPEKPPSAPEPKSFAARDAGKIAAALAKPSVAEEIDGSMRWGNSALPGRILLFAAQLHASGDPVSANLLASALFKAVNSDEALIDQAVGHLADTAYQQIAAGFFEDYDWDAYLASSRVLLGKYPRGWANAPAVALLVSSLEKRNNVTAKPSLPGIELNPKALSLIDRLMEKPEGEPTDEQLAQARGIDISDYPANRRAQIVAMLRAEGMAISYEGTGLWLLPEEGEEADDSPLAQLQAMGMDGFLALASVATDETLVPVRKSSAGSNHYSSNESPGENIRKRYRNLNRPATRAEIAAGLLTGVVPMPEDQYGRNETDPAALAEAAVDFWKANRTKSPDELAVIYMKEGSRSQSSQAATWLSSSKDPAAIAAFEAAVLASDEPLNFIADVDRYLSRRKAAAKPFADAYISLLRENPPDEQQLQRSTVGYQIREAGGLENYIRKLSLSVGDVSLGKLIVNALKEEPTAPADGEDEAKSPVMALGAAIRGIELDKCLIAFGKAASIATPEQWMEIHLLLRNRIYYELQSSEKPEGEGFPPLPDDVIALWKPLANRAETLPEKGNFPDYVRIYGGTSTGDASALILELAADPKLVYSLNSFAQIEGSAAAVIAFVRERATARAEGSTPEPWPDAENVGEERAAKILAKLETLKADEIIPYATSLTRDERLSLMQTLASYDDSNPAPAGLLELRQIIVTADPIFAKDHDAAASAKLGIAVGDKITAELLTRISDGFLKDAASESTTMVVFFPAAMNLGSNVLVTTVKDLDRMRARNAGLSYMVYQFRQFEGKDALSTINIGNLADVRALEDGKPVTLESEGSALDALEKSLEGKAAVLLPIRISILTREDAEKITNQDQ